MSKTAIAALQTFRHYKKGDLYLVLFLAEVEGSHYMKENDLLTCYVDDPEKGVRTMPIVRGVPGTLFDACYTGEPQDISDGEKLVVYVGLYDNPRGNRPCARPLEEWTGKVQVKHEGLNGELVDVDRYRRVT